MRLQRLVRDEDLPYASASDRWARFEVLDDDGVRVGLVSEEHAWVNHGGPARWTAVHDPTEDGRGVLWRGEGLRLTRRRPCRSRCAPGRAVSQDLARNLALAMGVVFVVVLLVSLPRMIRIRRVLGLPKFNWWVFLL